MDKRSLIAIVLIFVVYMISTMFFWKTPDQPPEQEAPEAAQEKPATKEAIPNQAMSDNGKPLIINEFYPSTALRIDHRNLEVFFGKNGDITEMRFIGANGQPVSVLPQGSPLFPMSINGLSVQWSAREFRDEKGNKGLSFNATSAGKVILEKRWTINQNNNLRLEVIGDQPADYRLTLPGHPGIDPKDGRELALQTADSLLKYPSMHIGSPRSFSKPRWLAIHAAGKAFAMIPGTDGKVLTLQVGLPVQSDFIVADVRNQATGKGLYNRFDFYYGPVNHGSLARYGVGLESLVSAPAQQIVLEDEWLRVRFSTVGAAIIGIEPIRYLDSEGKRPVSLLPANSAIATLSGYSANGQDISTYPFEYEVSKEDGEVRFYIPGENGQVIAEKVFTRKGHYGLEMRVNLHRDQAGLEHKVMLADPKFGDADKIGYILDFSDGIGLTEVSNPTMDDDFRVISDTDRGLNNFSLKDLKDEDDRDDHRLAGATINWSALRSKYFTIILLPDNLNPLTHLDAFNTGNTPGFTAATGAFDGDTPLHHKFTLYVGPLVREELISVRPSLETVADMGSSWLRPISRFFFWLLRNLYKVAPNWGVSILLFSLIMNLLLYPLSRKSMKAMKKMQDLQPQLREIQVKYKNDKQLMVKEQQRLYKEAGASPMGGCLPLLLQMPVFLALYPVLRYSIDLRQAHFIGWLNDLSAPDPMYILPIAMGITMFVQQKFLSPKPPDMDQMDEKQAAMMQSQKMMMYIMPVVFFFIFKSLPAGLVLYWFSYNIYSIITQGQLKRIFVRST